MWLKILCSKKHLLLLIIKQQQQIMADLTKLNDAVTNLNTTVEQAVTIINGSASDQAAIDTVTNNINTVQSTLATAIAAVTPPPTPAP